MASLPKPGHMTMGILLRSVSVLLDAGCGEKLKADAERMDEPSNSSPVIDFIFDEQVEPLNFTQYGRPVVMFLLLRSGAVQCISYGTTKSNTSWSRSLMVDVDCVLRCG